MLLSEYAISNNLFAVLENKHGLAFLADNAEHYNNSMIINYGDRTLFNKFENMPLDTVASIIYQNFGDRWNRELERLALDGTDKRVITETIDSNEVRANSGNTTNKISAFNTDELLVNDGADLTSNENLESGKVRTLTDTTYKFNSIYKNLSLVNKNSIMSVVLDDVSKFLTLSIY